jgi:NAD(P)-dependent dehydrogenase (short-subunit alcohol dehydrogenase family)
MTNRVVLITGAGRGIGRATAEAFGALGDHVVLAARTEADLRATAEAVEAAGGTATVVPCDVTAEPHVKRLIETASGVSGMIDIVICNAGVAHVAPFIDTSLADWERTVRVSLTGSFLVCKHAVPRMQRGGQIFVIGSLASRRGFPNWSAYAAAKFGQRGFAECIREELRPRGIRVTTVLAGAVDTPLWGDLQGMWDRAQMLQPADVAAAIVHAAVQPPHVSTDEIVLGHLGGPLEG